MIGIGETPAREETFGHRIRRASTGRAGQRPRPMNFASPCKSGANGRLDRGRCLGSRPRQVSPADYARLASGVCGPVESGSSTLLPPTPSNSPFVRGRCKGGEPRVARIARSHVRDRATCGLLGADNQPNGPAVQRGSAAP